ncbi:DUF1576 domain-containing protein [Geosporobacter ferrireducens]|uniref:DUF1576 domain-containing protein n=1 Tax=Geosporobacter ferrireducens TaxID=1424294 RepID=A0A1D8GJA1_9FIRM|nr:DUF1576 domain-containing protein [Geosporobacter ferrireducens]AOT70987.1 hypothetical protein Gferi_16300 [Geosporobacter ferrireducens]MTI53704.1 DUF1576 domain-containing protein [Geosporobacter ferrireducens]
MKPTFLYGESKLGNHSNYLVLIIWGLMLFVFGMTMDTPKGIVSGLYRLIIEPDFLITDYISIGGLGAAFVNAGLLMLISIGILHFLDVKITGAAVSSLWLMSGFGLFGKNLFNVWFIILGVWLYARYQKEKFSKYVYIALFGTSLAPTVTQVMFGLNLSKTFSIPLGILTGVVIGFILPPLSSHMMRIHQGFNLYNIGFTAGIIGTILVSIFKSNGLKLDTRMIWSTGHQAPLSVLLVIMFLSMLGIGYFQNGMSLQGFQKLYQYSGRAVTDFIVLEGFPITLMNMGINGLFATAYVILIGGVLNGPIIGGIFTIVGFSAFGKHLSNMLPIFTGVFLGGLTNLWDINDPGMVLAALFGTTLAPIAGQFGWGYGVLAGFLHSVVVQNVGYLHAGLNLYNNGFSGGIVAATLVPIIEAFKKED